MMVLVRMDYSVLVVYYVSTLCSSIAPVASSNSEVAAQSLNDSVRQLLTSFMDNVRSRLEHEVCVFVRMYVRMCTLCACAYVYVCVFMCMRVFMCMCVYVVCLYECACVCTYVCLCVCMHGCGCYSCVCVRMCICMCVYLCVYVCTCVNHWRAAHMLYHHIVQARSPETAPLVKLVDKIYCKLEAVNSLLPSAGINRSVSQYKVM